MRRKRERYIRRTRIFRRDYNHDVAGGKWNHMMDQTHIGYTDWHDPDTNTMPEVKELRLFPLLKWSCH